MQQTLHGDQSTRTLTPTTDANFRVCVPRRVRQTRALDVVRKRSPAVVRQQI